MSRAGRFLWIGGALLLALPHTASAHLLDAYLQAAQISIDPQRVALDLYLTPGVQIAPSVLAELDSDHNGAISAEECRRYAEAILPGLTLSVDGRPLTMQFAGSDAGSIEELRQGIGALHLRAAATLPPLTTGVHRVRFQNMFHPPGSLYLANAMLPRDQRIVIREQNRDALQTSVDITYDLRATKMEIFVRTGIVLLAAVAAWALWWWAVSRRRASKDFIA